MPFWLGLDLAVNNQKGLKLPVLIPLAQRIGARVNLGGLNEEETHRYIDWQVQTAGDKTDLSFGSAYVQGLSCNLAIAEK